MWSYVPLCGSRPARWSPVMPFLCSSFPHRIGITCVISRILWKWQSVTPKTMSEKTLQLLSCSFLDHCCNLVMRTCKQPYEEVQVGSWNLLPRTNTHLLNIWMNHLGSRSLAPSSLWMATALANILTATSWEILSQNNTTKLLPDFSHTETMWDNKCLLFWGTRFWGHL